MGTRPAATAASTGAVASRSLAPVVGVLALQGDFREHAARMESVGATTRLVRRATDLDGIDGLVLPGGESTAISNLIRVVDMDSALREYVAAGRPVYGSCAGMILLAAEVLDTRPDALNYSALDITVRRNAFGRQVDSFETEMLFDDVARIHAVFIRAPWVERVGPAAHVLAAVTDESGAHRAVAVRQGNALVTSFHPEVTDDLTVHRYFLDMVSAARAAATQAAPPDPDTPAESSSLSAPASHLR